MIFRSQKIGCLEFFLVSLIGAIGLCVEPKVYRADSSQLPPIDYSKQFDYENFKGFQKEFEVNNLEMKAARIPEYSGKLERLSMPIFQAGNADAYSKNLDLKEVEVRKAVEKWSRRVSDAGKTLSPKISISNEKPSIRDSKNADSYERSIDFESADLPEGLEGEALKRAINRGTASYGKVRVGPKRGFREEHLLDPVKAPLETTSPRKSEPSK